MSTLVEDWRSSWREATPRLISTFAVKRDLIAGLGVEELVVIPFDTGFASQTAEDDVSDVLVARPGAEQVSVGRPRLLVEAHLIGFRGDLYGSR